MNLSTIPWLKPARRLADAELQELFLQWHAAITPWLPGGRSLPTALRVVRDRAAAAAADAAASAYADAADAAAYDALYPDAAADADAAAADGACSRAVHAAFEAVGGYAAYASHADAVVAADHAARAANAADHAASAASAAHPVDIAAASDAVYDAYFLVVGFQVWPWWRRNYLKPGEVLLDETRWRISGLTEPSPWRPLLALFRLGAAPIGYRPGSVGPEFVIYAPNP